VAGYGSGVTNVPVIRGERVLLRPVREADIDARMLLGVDPEIRHMFGGSRSGQPGPLGRQGAERWYAELQGRTGARGWAIEHEGGFIGATGLHTIDLEHRRARFAIGILSRPHLGRGLGTEATRLVLGYGFAELGLHRIDLRVLAYNRRAIASYLKCGFVVEGRERDAALIDGEWHDDIFMSILEHEHRPPRPL
jgi:[ribosomal protein S5]-alanine N-acetyltransferase